MIVDGYGKVLSRPGSISRRELCIVAAVRVEAGPPVAFTSAWRAQRGVAPAS
jgi:hypothetical protein